ncbi:hypothetical protein FF38_01952 [Lucilia cuprina]|uniref:Uncharacterized protein n=1 Tax=Lucilia cuprina TaxID=7375 RepID=A0A0L0CQT4_LUCCU|nr:hypothetical protein CVS40_9074 [Lucilia cuprina]KNC34735.1 hypothetical protein FF38_01952 [Lucilia cuprina]
MILLMNLSWNVNYPSNFDLYLRKLLSQPNMDFDDVFLKARVSDCDTQIEYHYEDYDKIYNIFAARYEFHVRL